jgi:zinc/manganese transport system substrate-binding protein
MRHAVTLTATAVAATLLLAGCSAPADNSSETDAAISIVTSTNVYGDIAASIGGDLVEVTSIIDNPSQDPHSFEGSARVQLALSKADIVIENGGGYDDWADTLLAGADNADVTVLNASDISGYDQEPADGEFNEHVWYDFPTVTQLVKQLVSELSALDADNASVFEAAGADYTASLAALEERETELAGTVNGAGAAITEPVPLYLLAASGFTNVTPEEFSEAIEEGTDVSATVLNETIDLFAAGTATVLVYNEQTTGPETEQVLAAATAAGTPVVAVTETMPADSDYLTWMGSNLDALQAVVA